MSGTAAGPGPAREAVRAARRLVVKIGSSSLTAPDGGLDRDRVERVTEALASRHGRGDDVLVVSSGAVACGLAPLGLAAPPTDLATLQAAAAVGQAHLVDAWTRAWSRRGAVAAQVLLTADGLARREQHRNATRALSTLLDLHVVPVVNENDSVATSELRFTDNDRLAALVAHLVGADALLLLTDVDALHDGPPGTPGVSSVPEVADAAAVDRGWLGGTGSSVGRGGMLGKVGAASVATAGGVPVLLGAADAVVDLLDGRTGTAFAVTGRRRPGRLQWLAHVATTGGALHLDAGAVRAVTGRRRSLLAVGVTACTGDFEAGEPVDLVDPDGRVVARGLPGYDAQEAAALLGEHDTELVHADALVVLPAG